MVSRISALQGHIDQGRFGNPNSLGVTLELIESLQLGQIAAWPDSFEQVAKLASLAVNQTKAPKPTQSVGDAEQALLRIEPLKWWLIGAELPDLTPEQGACIDLSHSRTRLRVSGDNAVELLNRLLPLNLSEQAFPTDSVASSAIHHVGVTLWRHKQGYDLFIPRGFAVSVWQVLLKTSLQFGVQVVVGQS